MSTPDPVDRHGRSHTAIFALRNAAENASTEPIDDAGIAAILCGQGGSGSHRRAIFGDASQATILSAAIALGIDRRTVLRAYRAAREECAAANRDLDAALAEGW
jgi:outer membrane murein-binding lipoprotein Lpp